MMSHPGGIAVLLLSIAVLCAGAIATIDRLAATCAVRFEMEPYKVQDRAFSVTLFLAGFTIALVYGS